MNHINQLISTTGLVPSSGLTKTSKENPMSGEEWLQVGSSFLTKAELLFQRMTGLYSHKWISSYGAEPTPEWEIAIRDCSPQMIKRGIDRAVKQFKSWPPNPIEFRNLCFPTTDELGLPSDDQAFQQAVGNVSDRHPAVIFTLRNMGGESFRLRRTDEKTALAMFKKQWVETVQFVSDGGELPEPEKQIPERPQGTEAGCKKAAHSALAELRGIF